MTELLKALGRKETFHRHLNFRGVWLFVLFSICLSAAWAIYRSGAFNPALMSRMKDHHPVAAVAIFIIIYAVSVLASLPSLPLNLAAGFFWGGLAGGIFAATGSILGGWAAFSAARMLMGQPLAARAKNKWAARVAAEFERKGWKFVAFARINPIIPTGPLNYLLGLTALSNKGFLGASLFLLPPSIAVAYIGDILQSFTAAAPGVQTMLRGLLVLSCCITLLAMLRFATKIFSNKKN